MDDLKSSFRIGVVADTHIPDRRKRLDSAVLAALAARQPDLIIHLGDITTPKVIQWLEQVAPVVMVRGNRDFLFYHHVPMIKELIVRGTRIRMLHGHTPDIFNYLWIKTKVWLFRYRLQWFLPRLLAFADDADVILFGHSHIAEAVMIDGQLFFNPGSVNVPAQGEESLSFGMLYIDEEGNVQPELCPVGVLKAKRIK